jgi:hypothetical protein
MKNDSKVPKSAVKRQPPGGSRKGIPNKVTREVKEMILEALDNAGGVQYLTEQATENPKAFLSLLGRVMPLQVNGAGENGEHIIQQVVRKIVDPKA